jgi:hypothetical protein
VTKYSLLVYPVLKEAVGAINSVHALAVFGGARRGAPT